MGTVLPGAEVVGEAGELLVVDIIGVVSTVGLV